MKKSILLPALLLVYLAVMAYIGYPAYAAGDVSAFKFYGVIAVTFVVIVLLHLSLKKREKLKHERETDLKVKR